MLREISQIQKDKEVCSHLYVNLKAELIQKYRKKWWFLELRMGEKNGKATG